MRSINRCRHVKRGPPHPLQLGQCLCERTRFLDRWPRSNAADFVAAPSPSLRVTEANTGREAIVSWTNPLRAVLAENADHDRRADICVSPLKPWPAEAPGSPWVVKYSSFVQDLPPDDGQLVRLGPARRPFQTFTSTRPRARLGLVPCGAIVGKQNGKPGDPLA